MQLITHISVREIRTPHESQPTAGRIANLSRLFVGGVFIVSSGINVFVTLPRPEYYSLFADMALFPSYANMVRQIAVPNAMLISTLLVLYELTIGLLMLSKGRRVAVGVAGAVLFLLAITPAMGLYTLGNIVLAGLVALLLRYEYNRSLLDMLRAD